MLKEPLNQSLTVKTRKNHMPAEKGYNSWMSRTNNYWLKCPTRLLAILGRKFYWGFFFFLFKTKGKRPLSRSLWREISRESRYHVVPKNLGHISPWKRRAIKIHDSNWEEVSWGESFRERFERNLKINFDFSNDARLWSGKLCKMELMQLKWC